ncbi:sirohydrochlorin chelatase [bacterium AH-315-E10]|nr:sirohydrochlorin chelatase [bacterium AH-315-E10]
MTGILLCGHGSSHEDGVSGFLKLLKRFQERHPNDIVEGGFLELSIPLIESAAAQMYEQGVRDMVALPVFLFTGVHLRLDIPLLMTELMDRHEGLKIRMGSYIGVCDELVELCAKRIDQVLAVNADVDRADSLIFGIGVGASVLEANDDIVELTQLMQKKAGFSHSAHAFISPLGKVSISEALDDIMQLPQKHVVVVPLFLFNGIYLEDAFRQIQAHDVSLEKKFVICESFNSDDSVLDALQRRYEDVIDGTVDLTQKFDREKAETRARSTTAS